MNKIGQRIFASVMAGVFILSAVAFSAFVIYDMQQTRKKNDDLKAATSEQQAKSSAGKSLDNFTPVETVSQLVKTDTKEGEGAEVKPTDTITVDYTGAVAATGKIFESSKDTGRPATFPLNQVIDGWKEGIPGMKVGGVRRLVIPAEKAYGPNPPQGSSIPANAALVFDVTLLKIEAPAQASDKPAATSNSTQSQ